MEDGLDEAGLLRRARSLAGRSIGQVAQAAGLEAPPDLRGDKGFIGRLVERSLGFGGAAAGPDVAELGIELKTLPVDTLARPLESTFVATLDPSEEGALRWETSAIREKLARVLWIPIVGVRTTPPAARVVGTAVLWSPDADEEATLRADFEEIAELVADGLVDTITAHRGKALQLRPKGADAAALRWTFADGERTRMPPRAFYLRRSFTLGLAARFWRLG